MNGRLMRSLLVVGSMGSVGCAPLLHPHSHPHVATAHQPPPVGRWDLVMSIDQNLVITVMDAAGVRHTGRFIGADRDALLVVKHGIEVSIARSDVMRVDLSQRIPPGRKTVKRVALTAAAGALAHAGLISFIGTAMGGKLWIAHLRYWLAGAGIGAMLGVERDVRERRPQTIYVAPGVRTYW
jgi:hypothetical protein